jgi:uncharacterized protein (TIGR02001 family)
MNFFNLQELFDMNIFTKTMVAAALLGSTAAVQAELSANAAAASNYLFRGITQTGDSAAVSGGLDYNHDSGLYLGTWMSNVDFASAEVDIYAGYGGDISEDFGYDVGTLYYYYPNGGNIDYAEVYGNLSYSLLSGGIAYTYYGETDDGAFESGDIYYHASLDLPLALPDGFASSIFAGYYDFDEADSYTHWGLAVSKDAGDFGSFSVSYEQATDDSGSDAVSTDDTANFWVGWSKEF